MGTAAVSQGGSLAPICADRLPIMVPQEFFAIYVGANAIAFGILALAFFRPAAVRWVCVALFAWASVTNTVTALTNPHAYLGYAALTHAEAAAHAPAGPTRPSQLREAA
jgi:hypothetical protein